MKGELDGGCFPTGRHYPGISHLIRVTVQGLAQEWNAETPFHEIPWVSIDTETTRRDAENDRVIEVGAVLFRGGTVVEQKGWLIQPGCPIPPDATAVHGISDEDLVGKPSFAEVLPEIAEFLQGALPLAYNADFDRKFLLCEIARQGRLSSPPPAFRDDVTWVDPLVWAREIHKEERSRALGDVCARLGISLVRAHRATDDAEAAGRVMVAFLKDPRVPGAYGALMREQARLARLFDFERVRWRGGSG